MDRSFGPTAACRERVAEAGLFALLLCCFLYTFPRWADWNQNSRFDLVVAVVDHGTLSIDCCVENTGDYARFEGRAYSDKAPGLSFLALPVYWLFDRVSSIGPIESTLIRLAHSDAMAGTLREGGTGLLVDKIRFFLGLVCAAAAVVSIPAALLGVALFRFLGGCTRAIGPRLAVAFAYSLATVAFPYSGSFYAHQLVAALLFGAFVFVARTEPAQVHARRHGLAGLCLGWAVISEYPAVWIAAVLTGYVVFRTRRIRALLWLAAGASAPLLLAAAYNHAIYGTPLPLGYFYSELWHERHDVGFLSLTYPRLDALWGITFSPYRGLFFHCPVLLFGLAGLARGIRRDEQRAEMIVSLLAVAGFFAFNSASSMWWGGFAIGPRYMLPALPFLAWPMILFLRDRHEPLRFRSFAALSLISFVLVWGLSLAGQQLPEDSWRFPWQDYAWPRLRAGDLARNAGMVLGLSGWFSLLPLLAAAAILAAAWRLLDARCKSRRAA